MSTKTLAPCEKCPLRRWAEKRPESLIARIWRWHTGWCPGYRAYSRSRNDSDSAE